MLKHGRSTAAARPLAGAMSPLALIKCCCRTGTMNGCGGINAPLISLVATAWFAHWAVVATEMQDGRLREGEKTSNSIG